MLIALDYGHSKKADDGAYGILEEFKVNREYGSLIKKYLEQLGHTVDIVSKDTCTSESDALSYRVNQEHKKKYNLYISCHANCFNGSAEGCEVLYYSNTGKQYAEKIVSEIAKLGFKNRGAKYRNNLYVLKHTYAPAIIIEPFFIDNKHDCSLYNADKLARAIVKGITGKVVIEKPKQEEPKKPQLNVQVGTVVLYGNKVDKRMAEYLAEFLNCECLDATIPRDYSGYKEVVCVGGEPITNGKKGWTGYATKKLAGKDRYYTIKEVLKFMGKI